MNIGGRLRRYFTQTRQRALLAMNEGCELGVGQHKRIFRGDVRPTDRTQRRLDVFRQRRIAMRGKGLAVKLNLLRRRGKTTHRAVFVDPSVFLVGWLRWK